MRKTKEFGKLETAIDEVIKHASTLHVYTMGGVEGENRRGLETRNSPELKMARARLLKAIIELSLKKA